MTSEAQRLRWFIEVGWGFPGVLLGSWALRWWVPGSVLGAAEPSDALFGH
jgi:hypothetical protein